MVCCLIVVIVIFSMVLKICGCIVVMRCVVCGMMMSFVCGVR